MALDEAPAPDTEAADGTALPALQRHIIRPDTDLVDKLRRWSDPTQTLNICDELLANGDGQALLGKIGQTVVRQFDVDKASRSGWEKKLKVANDLAMQVAQTKTFPWPDASNVIYPIISEAAIQFAARAYPAIVSGRDVVKGVVFGKDAGIPAVDPQTQQPIVDPNTGEPVWLVPPGAKRARADRIANHMSWQLLEEMPEWEEETDKLCHILPVTGCAFRKTYFDSAERRNRDLLVLPEHLVVNYFAKSVETAPRMTETMKLYPSEIEEHIRSGTFLKFEYGMAQDANDDEDAPHDHLEQHRRLDLDGDGYPEPYIVTVHRQQQKVLRITSRFDADAIQFSGRTGQVAKIDPVHYYTKYDFLPSLDGSIYGFGYGHLLGPLNVAVNTALNQIFDAGTLQNTGGGFIGRGLSTKAGSVRRAIGEWTVLNVPGSKIRDAIVPLEHRGPSDTLFKLLGFLVEAAKELASNTEVLSGRQTQSNVPATTTLALIEQGMKVFTGVYKRIYRANGKDLDKHYRLNRLYLDAVAEYRRGEEWQEITRQDYEDGAGIAPISDPSMVSDMQQLARAEALKEFKDDPLVDRTEIRRRIFTAMHVEDIEDLIVKQAAPDPALMTKAEELRIKEIAVRAKALADMTLAVKNLASADATEAQMHLNWIESELAALENDIEAMRNGGQGTDAQGNPQERVQ